MNQEQRSRQAARPLAFPQCAVEAALVFAVFFIQGAYPVPDVNEPYYLGKAIHFWNPAWIQGDFFLETADSHQVFYATFGWLSLLLPPMALAWVGRLLTWGLLAWAWQRLSFAAVPRRWFSVLTAALLVTLIERCNMAGEWIVGGVEAKGFAYVLVFLGLEALLRDRWNRAWLLLGAAAALHVLVGGWSVVAAGLAWLILGKNRPAVRTMLPGLGGGLVLALPGLIPALMLTWGQDPQVLRQANEIYVYERLYHHLAPLMFPPAFVFRFLLLVGLWLVLCWRVRPVPEVAQGGAGCQPAKNPADWQSAPHRRLNGFVAAALIIATAGAAIALLEYYSRALAAGLLRFYWFRLADVAVPVGVALLAGAWIGAAWQRRPAAGGAWLAVALLACGLHLGELALQRPFPLVPRADFPRTYGPWRRACDFIAQSPEIPRNARFLTPRMAQTFKWYAGRPEVVNWKEVPQQAEAIVEWWQRLEDIHGKDKADDGDPWHDSLAALGAKRLAELGAKYHADYVLTERRPALPLPMVYRNETYVIYSLLSEASSAGSGGSPRRPTDGGTR